eukprot:13166414-Ditylum_brightwellii.AAC.1
MGQKTPHCSLSLEIRKIVTTMKMMLKYRKKGDGAPIAVLIPKDSLETMNSDADDITYLCLQL